MFVFWISSWKILMKHASSRIECTPRTMEPRLGRHRLRRGRNICAWSRRNVQMAIKAISLRLVVFFRITLKRPLQCLRAIFKRVGNFWSWIDCSRVKFSKNIKFVLSESPPSRPRMAFSGICEGTLTGRLSAYSQLARAQSIWRVGFFSIRRTLRPRTSNHCVDCN